MARKLFFLIWIGQLSAGLGFGQVSDTLSRPVSHLPLSIPITLTGLGLVSLIPHSPINRFHIRSEVREDLSGFRTHVDDYLQYTPDALFLGLTFSNTSNKHTRGNRIGTWVTANGIMTMVVFGIKHASHQLRPDGSSFDSFPSGHTANAFTGATLVYQEYGKDYPGLAIGSYGVATATGALRVINNRHWFSDVLVGAAIGILSAEAAHHLYPWMKNRLFHSQQKQLLLSCRYY